MKDSAAEAEGSDIIVQFERTDLINPDIDEHADLQLKIQAAAETKSAERPKR